MADDTNTPEKDDAAKPAPRRRSPRKAAPKAEAPKPAAKRASRPATTAPKKPAAKPAPKRAAASDDAKPSTRDRARKGVAKAADAVGGKRNVGLIAGGIAAAGVAAAALLSLRSSTPKKGATAANDAGPAAGGAHQADGTDSSAQMDAMIADEGMIPDAPQA